ncbi:MAG TPA: acyl-CoA dehydrogenase family protein [Candidatus Angelobacter sp.]|jgi:alkylation response protein AidB-like acyl-CoA dehydrogenase|nr:acyl-CoA dehydrogenase family protein [Candidatus Angelobacter sp.]
MDLTLSDAERAFQAECRDFMRRSVPTDRVPYDESGAWVEQSKRWQRTLAEGRWAVPGWPKQYGGREATPVELMLYEHELAAVHPPRAINVIGTGWAGAALLRHGSDEQQQRYLPGIPAAAEVWCQLFSEPNAGSDLAALQTRAARTPDGAYEISGQKTWSSLARVADRGILLARTDPTARKHHGISCFVLDMHAPGITVRPIKQITGESDFNEVFFDGVRIPESDRIGQEGEGWTVAITTLMAERIGLSAGEGTLWGTGPTWADVLALWQRRKEQGTLPQAPEQQAVLKDEMARLHVEGEALRLTGLRLLSDVARGGLPAAQMSVRKLASDIWGQQVHEAVWHMLGPQALVAEGDEAQWQRAYLFARALTIGGGTTEVQKDILARRILGLPV